MPWPQAPRPRLPARLRADVSPTAPGVEAPCPAFTLDTPIRVLAADAGARAVLERELPGVIGHARYEPFKAMSLKALNPFSGDLITDEKLAGADRPRASTQDE